MKLLCVWIKVFALLFVFLIHSHRHRWSTIILVIVCVKSFSSAANAVATFPPSSRFTKTQLKLNYNLISMQRSFFLSLPQPVPQTCTKQKNIFNAIRCNDHCFIILSKAKWMRRYRMRFTHDKILHSHHFWSTSMTASFLILAI